MNPEKSFTHIDLSTNAPAMVDVSAKPVTRRQARAQAVVRLGPEIMSQLAGNEIETKKGPVFQTAIIAGTMAVKKTSDLIPLCHPLSVEDCKIIVELKDEESVKVECMVAITSKTGVEMEALTGASVAALTIYDMCKSFSHHIEIKEIRLLEKTGGKNDFIRE